MSLFTELRKEAMVFEKKRHAAEIKNQPIFLKAINGSMERLFRYVDQFGIDNVPIENLLDEDPWTVAYEKVYQDTGLDFAKSEYANQQKQDRIVAKAIGFPSFLADIWTSALRDYTLKYTYDIPRKLNENSIDIITRALGLDYGLEIDRTGKVRLFKKRMGELNTARSFTVSRTETTTVANLGKEVAASQWVEDAGGGGYKAWFGRVFNERNEHLLLNNTIVPLDEPYKMSDDKSGGLHDCDRPGDVELPPHLRINCRCSQTIMSKFRYDEYVKRGMIIDGKIVA